MEKLRYRKVNYLPNVMQIVSGRVKFEVGQICKTSCSYNTVLPLQLWCENTITKHNENALIDVKAGNNNNMSTT